MKINYFIFTSMLLLLASCSQGVVVESAHLEGYPDALDTSRIYEAGQFVTEGRQVYQSTAKVKNRIPSEYTSSPKKPMNPWRISSVQEFAIAQSITAVPVWLNTRVYHANDVIRKEANYYKAMWWNQSTDPSLAENQNDVAISQWGPWVSITEEEAMVSILPSPVIPEEDLNLSVEDVVDGGSTDTSVEVDETLYIWSSTAVYTEGMLAILDGKYYKAKWWSQNNDPSIEYEASWDSPWQEITRELFIQLVTGEDPPNPPDVGPGEVIPPNPDPDVTVPPVNPAYDQIVQQGFIQEWNWDDPTLPEGIREAFNAAAVVAGNIFAVPSGQGALDLFSQQINEAKWNQLFPRRRGSAGWIAQNPGENPGDYYSFQNFSSAMLIIGEYAYMRDVALDSNTDPNGNETSFERNYVLHKPTRKVRLISQSADYFSADPSWLTNRIHRKKVVDYAAFGREGSENDKKRVVAGFLAHASHETSGSWTTAPGYAFDRDLFVGAEFPTYITDTLPGELAWSLYFNEEVAFSGATDSHYKDPNNTIFPPSPGQSYHGRGAFQLTWNYNYGLASAIFFGDSNVLLDNANFILTGGVVPANSSGTATWRAGETIQGGSMAFLTSLMFWLTPQGSKPSQQDTMILNRTDGLYVAGEAKLLEDSGLGEPGYGWTINIMNGGYEANKSWEEGNPKYDAKVARRVKHYIFFTQALGGNNTGEVLDTLGNHSY